MERCLTSVVKRKTKVNQPWGLRKVKVKRNETEIIKNLRYFGFVLVWKNHINNLEARREMLSNHYFY